MSEPQSSSTPRRIHWDDLIRLYMRTHFPGMYVVFVQRPVVDPVFGADDEYFARQARYEQLAEKHGINIENTMNNEQGFFLPFASHIEADNVYHEYRNAEPDARHRARTRRFVVTEDGSSIGETVAVSSS